MRLLLTLDFPPEKGGIQKYLYNIVRFQYGNNDHLLICSSPKYKYETFSELNCVVSRITSPLAQLYKKIMILWLIFPYLKICRKFKGSLVVECGNVYSAIIPWFLFRITGQAYRVYTYGTEIVALRKKTIKNVILGSVLKRAECIYTLGKYTSDLLSGLNSYKNIQIIQPKIRLVRPSLSVKRKNHDSSQLLSIGRLVKHKGHEWLVRSVNNIPVSRSWHLTIAGSGPDYNYLKTLCRKLNIESRVSIKNDLSDEAISEELVKADIFILPSLFLPTGTEGFGIVLLEAMMYNVPIIASNTGGIPEVLDNGNCGILVEPGNIEDLTSAILRLCHDRLYASELSKRAYNRLVDHYVWK